jgi:hypothetical protein
MDQTAPLGIKVVVVGGKLILIGPFSIYFSDGHVGKTCLLETYLQNKFVLSDASQLIGESVKKYVSPFMNFFRMVNNF